MHINTEKQLCLGNAKIRSVTIQYRKQQTDCAFVCSVADGHVTLPAIDFCQVLKINNVLNLIDADLSHLLM